jgi:crotonobetainyl-CoA:carnitine CoA-transferase CaiB-like acyl-CoA transferase
MARDEDWITLVVPRERDWARLLSCPGFALLGSKPEFSTAEARSTHNAELADAISQIIRSQPRAHWMTMFANAQVGFAPRLSVSQFRPQLLESGAIITQVSREGRTIQHLGLTTFHLSRTERRPGVVIDRVGVDTADVFSVNPSGAWLQTAVADA